MGIKWTELMNVSCLDQGLAHGEHSVHAGCPHIPSLGWSCTHSLPLGHALGHSARATAFA